VECSRRTHSVYLLTCCCHMYNIYIIIHSKICIFYQNKHARTLPLLAKTTVHGSMANRLNARQRQPIKHRKQKCVKSLVDILYYYYRVWFGHNRFVTYMRCGIILTQLGQDSRTRLYNVGII